MTHRSYSGCCKTFKYLQKWPKFEKNKIKILLPDIAKMKKPHGFSYSKSHYSYDESITVYKLGHLFPNYNALIGNFDNYCSNLIVSDD